MRRGEIRAQRVAGSGGAHSFEVKASGDYGGVLRVGVGLGYEGSHSVHQQYYKYAYVTVLERYPNGLNRLGDSRIG